MYGGSPRKSSIATCTAEREAKYMKAKKALTFAMFQASGRYVEDLEQKFPGEYEARTPGRIYAGELVIEDSLGCTAGAWMLNVGNSSECSDDLAALERKLYDYGRDEGHIAVQPEKQRPTNLTRWTYSIDDTDGNGEAGTTFTCTDPLETKVAAYYAMCAVFDGPVPEVEEENKQYVPPAKWQRKRGIYVWDVYSDRTFVVRVFPAGRRGLPTRTNSWL